MSSSASWTCLLPSLVTIVLALGTRRVLLSLFAGVLLGHALLDGPNLLGLPFAALDQLIDVATNRGNMVLIAFSLLLGGLLSLIKDGRGFEAFAALVGRHSEGRAAKPVAFGLNWLLGGGLFLDTWSNVLVNGATTGALYDRLGLSRLRLAYFAHTIAICIVSIAVVNGWGAF
jgi:tetracycline resistance efflux pump